MALAIRKSMDIKGIVKSRIDGAAFDAWILPLLESWNGNRATLVAASRFNRDFIQATFGRILKDIGNENGVEIDLAFSKPDLRILENPANNNENPVEFDMVSASFDAFICSEANQFALSAVKKCAAGRVSFSPLVIYGGCGSGKTKLLGLLKRNAASRAIMTTGAGFVSDFVRAMQTNAIFAFKDLMRGCDMFIMDDIQSLAGKRASADEFASLLDDLMRMGKTVVLASDIAPGQITGFSKRLVSILASGLSVDLSAPDESVREKILVASDVELPIAKKIATRTPANGHIIAGVAKKIAAWRELDCGTLDEPVLEKLLGDVLTKQNTPSAMVRNMCAKLGVAFDDVMSGTRTRAIVFARQKIMAALKMSTHIPLAEIGRLVGGRDHASVLYALAQIEKAKESDMLLDSEIQELAKHED